jgi:hypothetical protein
MPYVATIRTRRRGFPARAANRRARVNGGAQRAWALRAAALAAPLAAAVLAAGCGSGTEHPGPISARELREAQTFPYYRVYWVGPDFRGEHLSAADGRRGYIERIGDSLYYGDCVKSKGIFGGGSCVLPLQVTTVIYRLHSNAPLGPQRNTVVRGVPATIYDQGHSIEIYTGREAIDVFSDTLADALAATQQLQPVNAPGTAIGPLPPPVYCPGLSGAIPSHVAHVMASLPHRICQRDAAQEAYAETLET